MDDFESELKLGFLDEASQMLGDVEQCFLTLESNPNDLPTLEKIFRIAHNIKGSSKAVGFDALGAFTHEFETFLLKCKSGKIIINGKTISLFLKCIDHIKDAIDRLKVDQNATMPSEDLVVEIKNFDPQTEGDGRSEVLVDVVAGPSEVVISEVLVEAPATVESVAPPPTLSTVSNVSKTPPAAVPSSNGAPAEESIRVSFSRLERLLNFVGEMVILQTVLKEQAHHSTSPILRRTIGQMGKVTKEVQDLSMGLRMVPLKQTFQKMQRIVRDTSTTLGKKVQFVLEGEDTEVDKTVLEALGDPLVHLVRNAVDHGIEAPVDRVAKGKSEQGQIILRAYHQSGKLVIEVRDNGGGISADRLRQKAAEKGILKPGQTISERDAIHLIFHPGFSTKAEVTEVSGRGVGMDVVKTNIEQLQGEIVIDTELNQGSVFKVILPLTLAIIDGMIVRLGDERFVIPLSQVHETLRLEQKMIKFATGLGDVLLLRGENIPIIKLSQVLGRKEKQVSIDKIAVITRNQSQVFATLVDDILGQSQVVIKKLGAETQHLRGYSGSAILGDGKPALILELGDLVSIGTVQNQRRLAA